MTEAEDGDDFVEKMRREAEAENKDSPFAHQAANEGYQQQPPGAATRVFMDTAGIFKRRTRQRFAAIIGTIVTITLIGLIAGDLSGLYEIPGMGVVYDVTGIDDPSLERAIERTEEKLVEETLSPAERERLRKKLLGLETKARGVSAERPSPPTSPDTTIGIADEPTLDKSERALANDIFGDTRKSVNKVQLEAVSEVQTPNLPDGLTQEAIVKVIEDNQRSMGLCIAAALKGGEKLPGKVDVEMTIIATGRVSAVALNTPETSEMTRCTRKTVKRWRFPRFNGEPVPVSFPFILSAGL